MEQEQKDAAAEKLLDKMTEEYQRLGYNAYSDAIAGDGFVNYFFPTEEAARKKLLLYYADRLVQLHKANPRGNDWRLDLRKATIVFLLRWTVANFSLFRDDEIRYLLTKWREYLKDDYYWFH